jgi:hypothetical protein
MAHEMTAAMQRCIDNCSECHDICVQTVTHCLTEGGKHAEAEHIRLLLDCVEICQTSADFMLRGSPFHVATCATCADICEGCAESCAQFSDDAMMERCAETCRRCAASCREMSGTKTRAAGSRS